MFIKPQFAIHNYTEIDSFIFLSIKITVGYRINSIRLTDTTILFIVTSNMQNKTLYEAISRVATFQTTFLTYLNHLVIYMNFSIIISDNIHFNIICKLFDC